jgi:hypothetical protein
LKKTNYLIQIISIIISSLILVLSFNQDSWNLVFEKYLFIDAANPPFADLDSISNALKSKNLNFNPYINNPFDIKGRDYIYPSFWLYLFDFFNLDKHENFKIFCFIIIYLYSFIFFKVLSKIKIRKFKILFFLTFFSTSNFMIIERLNIDIIVFILIFFLAVSKNYFSMVIIFLVSIYSKLYPIFTIFIFLKNKKLFLIMFFSSIIIFYLIRDEIIFLINSGVEYALLASHGIPSITKGFWYYSMKHDFFINNNNYLIFKYFFMLLGFLYTLIIIKINFRFGPKTISQNNISFEEKLFICGGGIFIGRFIVFGNFDYALIFLILTLPYIFEINEIRIKYIYLFTVFLCLNSLIFESGDRYQFTYFLKSSLFHFFKIIIFSINCFYFGKILNKYIEINFNSLRFKIN